MKKVILIVILVLAFILRFWKLSDFPALNADEAAIGYNVYSLLQTGKDEHGNPWPIHFQSFNDYKPGLYFYLVLPFVKVLGLTELAVRIPSALLAVATVLIVYFLAKEIFKDQRVGIAASFFLAISPWHIHFSRGGWEVNAATFFITTGMYFFIVSAKNGFKLRQLLYSIGFFVFALYTYHAARIVVPLLGLGLLASFRSEIPKSLKKLGVAIVIGAIALLPLAIDLAKPAISSRASGVGIFADSGPRARIEEQRNEHQNFTDLSARILHNKVVNYGLVFMQNWSEHYWGEFLFLSGDEIQRNRVPEMGQMYYFDMLFLLVGVIALVKSFNRFRAPLMIWLVVAPVAAALTFQSPHALRAHNMVIPLVITSAFGLVVILDWLKTKKWVKFAYLIVGVFVLWNFVRYQHMYWVHMPKEYPYSSQYGVKELVKYVGENKNKYQKVLVTDRYDQPYILFLFYTKYPPNEFQNNHTLTPRDRFGFSTVNHFDKYYFTSIKFDEARPDNPNSLIIGTDEEIPNEANVVGEIQFPNGKPAFQVVAN